MFHCSLQILISQGHHLHLGVYFHFSSHFPTERVYHYIPVPQLSALQLILAGRGMRLHKVAPYLFSLHGFIVCRFYN